MTRAELRWASPNAHLLIGEMPAPRQMHARWWEGTGLSIAAHAIAFALLFYAATHVKDVVATATSVTKWTPMELLTSSGPGRGRGRGDENPAKSTRPPESSVPRPHPVTPVDTPAETPAPEITVPVVMTQATDRLPGSPTQIDSTSPGKAAGPGHGGGPGSGNGPDGPGQGPGRPGAFSGDTFGPGNDVSSPQLINEVKPSYTGEAMRAKVQGIVEMEVVVLPDGTVDPSRMRITRSLDANLGLDQQAVIAVKQWRFRPGMRRGQAVAVWVAVELTFTLR